MRFLSILILSVATFSQTSASAPPQGSQNPPVADENATKAKALINQAIQALGGDAYLRAQDMTQQGRTYSFHAGEATSTGVLFWRMVKFLDKERVEFTKQRDVSDVFNGLKGYEITYKGTAQLDAKQLADYLRRRDHAL